MNKKYAKVQSTRRSLIMSILSLMLCFAMLIGTTYAWFTDSVTSGRNKIVAGNLDVELYHNDDEKIDEDTDDLFDVDLWEPGVICYENFTVKNVGTLALKYAFSLNVYDKNTFNGHDLSEVIKVAVVDGGFDGERTDAHELTYAQLGDFQKPGKLAANGSDTYGVVLYWEPTDHDNDYNVNNGQKTDDNGTELFIEFGVKLVAAQDTVEADSFDNQYDKNAALPWSGSAVSADEFAENVDETEKTIEIWKPEELAYFAVNVSDYKNYTINIMQDIDLDGKTWTPLNGWDGAMNGITIDGNAHSIKNMIVYNDTEAGFIGRLASSGVTVKNLTFDGAKVSTKEGKRQSYAGVLIGKDYATATIENVNVKNSTVTNNWQCGGIIGFAEGCAVTLKKCSVDDSSVGGLSATAGTVFGLGQVGVTVEDCTAKNVTLYTDSLSFNSTAKADGTLWVGHLYTNTLSKIGTNTETDVNVVYYVKEGIILSNDGNTYSIFNTAGLMNFAKMVNDDLTDFAEKTVKLDCDVDLAGIKWTTIGAHGTEPQKTFAGTFDGQGHKISNMNIAPAAGVDPGTDGLYVAGLFGFIGKNGTTTTVKNLVFENCLVAAQRGGIAVGEAEHGNIVIDNINVHNSTLTVGQKSGGIIGYVRYCDSVSITKCDVDGLTFNGYNYQAGGIIGDVYIYKNSTITISENTVTNANISPAPSDNSANPIIGEFRDKEDAKTSPYSIAVSNNGYTNCTGFPTGANEFYGSFSKNSSSGEIFCN